MSPLLSRFVAAWTKALPPGSAARLRRFLNRHERMLTAELDRLSRRTSPLKDFWAGLDGEMSTPALLSRPQRPATSAAPVSKPKPLTTRERLALANAILARVKASGSHTGQPTYDNEVDALHGLPLRVLIRRGNMLLGNVVVDEDGAVQIKAPAQYRREIEPFAAAPMSTVQTRDALAASRGHGKAARQAHLTHSVEVDSEGRDIRVLCDRIELDNIADPFSPVDHNAPPTCPVCRSRDPRFKGKS